MPTEMNREPLHAAQKQIAVAEALTGLEIDIDRCVVCSQVRGLGLHHAVFKSKGGKEGPVVPLCLRCHENVHQHEWTLTLEADGLFLYDREGQVVFRLLRWPLSCEPGEVVQQLDRLAEVEKLMPELAPALPTWQAVEVFNSLRTCSDSGWRAQTRLIGEFYCLRRDSLIVLADGRKKQIADMVADRDPGPVLSIEAGRLVGKHIVGWHTSSLENRRWIGLSYERARTMRPNGRRPKTLWLTDDHEVLTPDGWKPAGALHDGDPIVTDEREPSAGQEEILAGTMLGDAGIYQRRPSRAHMEFAHCHKQWPWLQLKLYGLSGLGWTVKEKRGSVIAYSATSAPLGEQQEAWYGGMGKIVPRVLIGRCFSPRLLATWYLDDGSLVHMNRTGRRGSRNRPAANLWTLGLSQDDVGWLAVMLQSHGYDCSVHERHHRLQKRHSWYIFVTSEGAAKLFEDIAPFVPPAMRYKLPDGLTPFCEELWRLAPADPYIARAVIREGCDKQKTAYCLDVEDTHLFFASGLAVHNSYRMPGVAPADKVALLCDLFGIRRSQLYNHTLVHDAFRESPALEGTRLSMGYAIEAARSQHPERWLEVAEDRKNVHPSFSRDDLRQEIIRAGDRARPAEPSGEPETPTVKRVWAKCSHCGAVDWMEKLPVGSDGSPVEVQ